MIKLVVEADTRESERTILALLVQLVRPEDEALANLARRLDDATKPLVAAVQANS